MRQLHHIGLFSNNPKRIIDFYVNKLGFKKESQSSISKETIGPIFGINQDCLMTKLKSKDLLLEIFSCPTFKFKARRPETLGYNHFGLQVRDKQEFCRRLERKFNVKVKKINRGTHYTFFLQDPDKNLIEIMEPRKR